LVLVGVLVGVSVGVLVTGGVLRGVLVCVGEFVGVGVGHEHTLLIYAVAPHALEIILTFKAQTLSVINFFSVRVVVIPKQSVTEKYEKSQSIPP
jgi:hypothetical protein